MSIKPAQIHNGLAIYQAGSGEPILFMPGPHRYQRPGIASADAIIQGLADIGRQVIIFDPPGSGYSTRPAHLSLAEMFDCTNETLAACGISGPVDMIGHSMGGLTALAYTLEYPDRVRRLVLIGSGSGTPAYVNAPGSLANRKHPAFFKVVALGLFQFIWPRRASQLLSLNLVHRISYVDQRWFKPERITLRDWLRPRIGRTDWHWVARKLDYAPRLGEIARPTLILGGRHDPQFPAACSEELAAGIPGAQMQIFERSGHYPFIEESEAFWQAVGDFLH